MAPVGVVEPARRVGAAVEVVDPAVVRRGGVEPDPGRGAARERRVHAPLVLCLVGRRAVVADALGALGERHGQLLARRVHLGARVLQCLVRLRASPAHVVEAAGGQLEPALADDELAGRLVVVGEVVVRAEVDLRGLGRAEDVAAEEAEPVVVRVGPTHLERDVVEAEGLLAPVGQRGAGPVDVSDLVDGEAVRPDVGLGLDRDHDRLSGDLELDDVEPDGLAGLPLRPADRPCGVDQVDLAGAQLLEGLVLAVVGDVDLGGVPGGLVAADRDRGQRAGGRAVDVDDTGGSGRECGVRLVDVLLALLVLVELVGLVLADRVGGLLGGVRAGREQSQRDRGDGQRAEQPRAVAPHWTAPPSVGEPEGELLALVLGSTTVSSSSGG